MEASRAAVASGDGPGPRTASEAFEKCFPTLHIFCGHGGI